MVCAEELRDVGKDEGKIHRGAEAIEQMKYYWIETYGCQMNVAEAEALELELLQSGWGKAPSEEAADAVILHTCSVRQTAEDRIWGRIGYYRHVKQNRKFTLLVMGCMAERLKEEIIRSSPEVDLVVGNFAKHSIVDELNALDTLSTDLSKEHKLLMEENGEFRFSPAHAKEGSFHSYIPIMHGCSNYCTYCIVPYVRGREISRSPSEIMGEIEHAEEAGVREVTLLGQNVNSYAFEENGSRKDFPQLLSLIVGTLDRIEWLRFVTSHPKDVSPRLIALIAEEEKLCRHFHLPVQHGSDKILRSMNRRYSRRDYLTLVKELREQVPDISLTTDILVGFPGEKQEDFEALLSLMKEVRFDDAFMYYFNPREGTPAAQFEHQVPRELKLERLSEVIALQRSISLENRQKRIGSRERVMVDSVSKKNDKEMRGHTEKDEPVVFPGEKGLIGSLVPVKLEGLAGTTFKGTLAGAATEGIK
ncbi:MAG: tRNA (N6-isopentenyl adenosine(37)-C2)-methylthiotransferase MiaB [Spirochaetaceae bacterium]